MSSYIIENGQVVIRAKTEVFVQRDPTVFIKGDPGPPGPPGPPGDGSAFYKHTQNTPSATWTIIHNLNFEPWSDVEFKGKIQASVAPENPNDLVNFGTVNALLEGFDYKDAVLASAPSNINLNAPGSVIGGVTMTLANSRFIAANQTNNTENGLYNWNGASVLATRTADASTGAELRNAIVTVASGTGNNDNGVTYRQITQSVTLGISPVIWQVHGSGVPDASETTAGKVQRATLAELEAGTDTAKYVTPSLLASWSGRHLTVTTPPFGDGVNTVFVITHTLVDINPGVDIIRNSGNRDTVGVFTERLSNTSIRLTFASTAIPPVNGFVAKLRP